ncbi:MAG: DUF4034 domain-containing protein [Sideroxyarcus sp.]|nr:DUF4034 domain-containing protein [Sideroxyarcus sp.]
MISHKALYRHIFIIFALMTLIFARPILAQAEENAEFSEDSAFFQKSYLLLSTKRYEELDQLYKQYVDLYADHQITAEELAKKFGTFARTPGLDPRYDEWIEAFPASYSARLARGICRSNSAWEKRGSNMARNTSDAQFRGFGETLLEARSDLEASLALDSRPVNSYRYLIRVTKGLGHDGQEVVRVDWHDLLDAVLRLDLKAVIAFFRDLFQDSGASRHNTKRGLLDAALKLDPEAMNVRFEYMDSITPKWGGSEGMLEEFYAECNQSSMSDKNKKVMEGKYYFSLGEQARFDKDFKSAADYFYKYYLTNKEPANLQLAGQALLDGDFNDLAFERFDELVKNHPEYSYGYELRGTLNEHHIKDIENAIKDYLVASERGANWSQNRMGWFYMMGINVPVDYVKAKHQLDLAAMQGNITAKENLITLERLLGQPGAPASTNAMQPGS